VAVLRDLKARGLRAPVLAIGDGALGFWAALREVGPQTREKRCWVHRLANGLDKLPTRLQPSAKRALHEMMYAESRVTCEAVLARFVRDYAAKYSKAVKSLVPDQERLLTHFDFPAAPGDRPVLSSPNRDCLAGFSPSRRQVWLPRDWVS
jgi:transposase-like protein